MIFLPREPVIHYRIIPLIMLALVTFAMAGDSVVYEPAEGRKLPHEPLVLGAVFTGHRRCVRRTRPALLRAIPSASIATTTAALSQLTQSPRRV